MPLPYTFLLGVFALLFHDYLDDRLPAPVSALDLLPWLPLIAVPAAAVLALRRSLEASQRRRRLLAILTTLSAPAVFMILLGRGRLGELAGEWAPGSYLVEVLILTAPLVVMEFLIVWVARGRGTILMHYAHPFRLPLVLLILSPLVLFAAATDALFLSRDLRLFFSWTSLGSQIGMLVFLALLAVVMPLLFRVLMPISRYVPEDLRDTARSLGFPGDRVCSMETGDTIVNAALIGFVRWPIYLMLTDGLLKALDPVSLRGVVAHEVGHARAGHPIILVSFVLIPILLLPALALVDLGTHQELLFLIAGAAALAAMYVARKVFHRFEYEADQLAAEALGGAQPCIGALQRVSQLLGAPHRSSFRHPSDVLRIDNMQRCEQDPAYRARFHSRGRILRRLVLAGILLAVVVAGWAQLRHWPLDQATLLTYTGRFEAAAEVMKRTPNLAPEQQKAWDELRAELSAAQELYPKGGDWMKIRDDLAQRSYARARQVLASDGPAAARAWFGLALVKERPSPLDISLYLFCRAEAQDEKEYAARLRQHLLKRLQPPDDIRRALGSD